MRYLVVFAWMATIALPTTVVAQRATRANEKPVLFVCEHGTVKSLLAKVLFERYAAQVGLNVSAVSRGTNPDSTVPSWMRSALEKDNVKLGAWRPQKLGAADLNAASIVISFDVPSAATASGTAPHEAWNALPSVSADYITAREAIKFRVKLLVDSLKHATNQRK